MSGRRDGPAGGHALNFTNMRYALAICEERNFTRAAEKLGVRQPSVSNAIKRLEARLGLALFSRGPSAHQDTEPTTIMLAIKPHLEQALLNLDRAKQAARALSAKEIFR